MSAPDRKVFNCSCNTRRQWATSDPVKASLSLPRSREWAAWDAFLQIHGFISVFETEVLLFRFQIQIERVALTYVHHHVWNRSLMGSWCIRQGAELRAFCQPGAVGWGGRWEGTSRERGHMYTCGWLLLTYGRNQHNTVKELSSNWKEAFKKWKQLLTKYLIS